MRSTLRNNPPKQAAYQVRSGHVLGILLGAGTLVAAGTLVTYSAAVSNGAPIASTDQLPDDVVLRSTLLSAGLAPEALAVAGLTGEEADTVLSAATDAARPRIVQLRIALDNKHAAERRVNQLKRQSGVSEFELAGAKDAARSAVQTYEGLIALISTPALNLLGSDELRRFNASHANTSTGLPLHYRAHPWSATEANEIAQASRQKAASEARGETLEAEFASTLSQADLNEDVAVASQSLDTRLAEIRITWDLVTRGGD